MAIKGKKYQDSAKLFEKSKLYDRADAIELVCQTAKAKFDETIEVHVRLGVDSRHADQQVRGAVVLPHGTGKSVRVLALVKPEMEEAAKAAGDKKVEMLPMKDLLATTGYIRGGCSPIGMKKRFPTFLDPSAFRYETIAVSAGQRGVQVLLSPEDLRDFVGAKTVELM